MHADGYAGRSVRFELVDFLANLSDFTARRDFIVEYGDGLRIHPNESV